MNDRDTFAAYAMSALIGYSGTGTENYEDGSRQSYRWADEMVKRQAEWMLHDKAVEQKAATLKKESSDE